MKSWADFKIGKKYRVPVWTKEIFVTCVGVSLKGIPIMENACQDIHRASSFGGGKSPEFWAEYKVPREFWIDENTTIFHSPLAVSDGVSLIHVIEVIED